MSGGFARTLAVLLTALALSGCIEGGDEPAHTHDVCADDHAMEHGDENEAMDSEAAGNESADEEPTNETLQLMQTRQQGNDTGSENENELPEDNEHGEMAESGHHEECPADAEAEVDSVDEDLEEGNATVNGTTEYAAVLDASSTSAQMPADITFTAFVEAYIQSEYDNDGDGEPDQHPIETGAFTWTLDLGDETEALTGDESARGDDGAITATHTYEAEGDYTAAFSVVFEDGEQVTDELAITITAPKPVPSQTYFEFGPGPGCAGDAGPEGCASYWAGDSGPFIDAFWIPLDESYVGWSFTSTVANARGDSDGWLMDADHNIITDVNGGGTEAVGTIPPGAAWLFIFSYAEPHLGMTVTFTE